METVGLGNNRELLRLYRRTDKILHTWKINWFLIGMIDPIRRPFLSTSTDTHSNHRQFDRLLWSHGTSYELCTTQWQFRQIDLIGRNPLNCRIYRMQITLISHLVNYWWNYSRSKHIVYTSLSCTVKFVIRTAADNIKVHNLQQFRFSQYRKHISSARNLINNTNSAQLKTRSDTVGNILLFIHIHYFLKVHSL